MYNHRSDSISARGFRILVSLHERKEQKDRVPDGMHSIGPIAHAHRVPTARHAASRHSMCATDPKSRQGPSSKLQAKSIRVAQCCVWVQTRIRARSGGPGTVANEHTVHITLSLVRLSPLSHAGLAWIGGFQGRESRWVLSASRASAAPAPARAPGRGGRPGSRHPCGRPPPSRPRSTRHWGRRLCPSRAAAHGSTHPRTTRPR
jgi:hypothetical protein